MKEGTNVSSLQPPNTFVMLVKADAGSQSSHLEHFGNVSKRKRQAEWKKAPYLHLQLSICLQHLRFGLCIKDKRIRAQSHRVLERRNSSTEWWQFQIPVGTVSARETGIFTCMIDGLAFCARREEKRNTNSMSFQQAWLIVIRLNFYLIITITDICRYKI